jgi:prefoldin subunit 5
MRTQRRRENARDDLERRAAELQELEADLRDVLADLVEEWTEVAQQVEQMRIGLERDDIDVDEVALAWIPRHRTRRGR